MILGHVSLRIINLGRRDVELSGVKLLCNKDIPTWENGPGVPCLLLQLLFRNCALSYICASIHLARSIIQNGVKNAIDNLSWQP